MVDQSLANTKERKKYHFLKVSICYVKCLRDLDIDLPKIKQKFYSIITQKGIKEHAECDDLAGPILVCILFGLLLLCVTIGVSNAYSKAKFSLATYTDLV